MGNEREERERERETGTKRWALEWAVLQIAPPALKTPATTSRSSARLKLKSAEFLTRARTSNDRDVFGRTRARKPRPRAASRGVHLAPEAKWRSAKKIFIASLIASRERERARRSYVIRAR